MTTPPPRPPFSAGQVVTFAAGYRNPENALLYWITTSPERHGRIKISGCKVGHAQALSINVYTYMLETPTR